MYFNKWIQEFILQNKPFYETGLSPLLFILEAEALACTIRKINNIRGIRLPLSDHGGHETAEAKINAYVDDSQLFVSTEDSIVECFRVLDSPGRKLTKIKHKGFIPVLGEIKYPNVMKQNGQMTM